MAGFGKDSRHCAKSREYIRASCLIKRLCAFALGEMDEKNNCAIEMSPAQVQAALGLLRKTVPDLTSIELEGEVKHRLAQITDQPLTAAEWAAKYGQQSEPESLTH